jgi:rhodanese-related sulfurtransferase
MDRLFEFMGNHWELWCVFAGLLIALWYTEKLRAGQSLSPFQVTQLINQDKALIVDVRDKKDFSEGRITGALHIPFSSLKDRFAELKVGDEKQIIIVDKMGQHSGAAGKMLKVEGFENVSRLSGGIAEWRSSNMPLVRK